MACNESVNIDLHIHSDASDGTLSPSEILTMARHLELGAIAITDHDTVAGSKTAISVGIPDSLNFLTGIEISAHPPPSFPCAGSFHILGYGINADDPLLNRTLDVLQEARKNRNPRVIERLTGLGIEISPDELTDNFKGCQIGRPHIARLMVKKGVVSSVNEAFDKYLSRGKPAYADKYRVDCREAIEVILGAGGIPVLAHPVLLDPLNEKPLEYLISLLKSMGLKGIEVYYPEHSPEQTARYAEIAGQYDLLMTGGTDFHGSLKPEIRMGSGRGDFSVPYALYEKLIRASS
ncbi:PHP domain-containing protein [Desulfococcaceae bacterium HSG8]|nr:PHP domain-containing protein [Desulfococcaceae bacterium HSG8]